MDADKNINTLDIVVISSVAGIFLIYYTYYWYTSHHPVYRTQTQLGRNLEMMILWSQKHAEQQDPASVTLAVQTMRNSIIVAIFVGGAALQAGTQILNFGEQYTYQVGRPDTFPSMPLMVRAGIIATLLIMSFLNWALVIRYNNHAGFMIGALDVKMRMLENQAAEEQEQEQEQVQAQAQAQAHEGAARRCDVHVSPSTSQEGEGGEEEAGERGSITAESTAGSGTTEEPATQALLLEEPEAVTSLKRVMRLVALHFAWGFRCIFMAIPFFFYHIGVIPLIVSAVFMLLFLWYFDDPTMAVPESKVQRWGQHVDTPALRKSSTKLF